MTGPRGRRGARDRCAALAVVAFVLGGLGLLAPGPPRAAAQTPDDPGTEPVTLRLDAMAPRLVTSDGPPELLITGRLANSGAVPVSDLGLRAQRGEPLTGERATRRALDGADPAEAVTPAFTQVAGVLDPGEDVPFGLRVPLRGSPETSLALTAPGVYPLLVNANGTLGAGGRPTRLGAVRMLLPVVGLPAAPGTRAKPVAAPPVGQASRVGVLYPIADRPRRLPVLPGAVPLLTDDDLAASLAPGGRLSGLLDALERSAPLGSPAAASVCLAVDADLLETARVMAGGYQVRTPNGSVAGRGAVAADRWLARARAQARGRCVIALPYADTDLVAASRGNLPDLTTVARTTGARRVSDLLGVDPIPDATWPAGGVLDERTLSDLTTGGLRSLVLDGDVLSDAPAGGVARLTGPVDARPLAVAVDPVASAALAPRPSIGDGATGETTDAEETAEIGDSPAGTSSPLSVQDALGTLVQRVTAERSGPRSAPPATVVAPPTRWEAGPAEAGAYLDAVGDLTRLGLVRPVDIRTLLAGAVAAGPALPAASLAAPEDGAGPGLGDTALARVRVVRDQQRDLLAASERDRIGAPSPPEFFDPLTEGLMRSLSAAWRGDATAENAALDAIEDQMDTLRSMVRVVQPSGSYSLGSDDAPLLVTVDNQLPVAVRVQVVLEPAPGLRTTPVPADRVPAFSSRQFQVGVEVVRSGQFSVDAQAQTPGGEPLGPTARLLLRSTAYGTITVWLTASAAVVLVILASVRITRRVRAARRDRRAHRNRRRGGPPTRPGPEPPTRELQAR